jgi:hypothetical protein
MNVSDRGWAISNRGLWPSPRQRRKIVDQFWPRLEDATSLGMFIAHVGSRAHRRLVKPHKGVT